MALQAYLVALGIFSFLLCGVLPALEVQPRTMLIPRRGEGTQESSNQALFACIEVLPDRRPRRPRMDVVWLKDGNALNTHTRKYRNYGLKKRLLVRNVVEEDAGMYECTFSLNSTEKGRAELWIAPYIVEAPYFQNLPASGNGTVVCRVSGHEGVREVQWRKAGRTIACTTNCSEGSRYSVLPDGSLRISVVNHGDRGSYECHVSNPAGQQTTSIEVTVGNSTFPSTEPPQTSGVGNTTVPSTEPPQPSEGPSNCLELEDITFNSTPPLPSPTSPPTPSVVMRTEGQKSSPVGVPGLTKAEAPYFTMVPPRCVQTTAGYSIVLNCSAGGFPPPRIQWRKNTETSPLNTTQATGSGIPHFSQLPDGSLQINTAQVKDKGVYTCIAWNNLGEKSASVRVKVRGETEVCGVTVASQAETREKRVVQGQVVSTVQDHPWQVLIEYTRSLPGVEQLCGGALLRPDWVVTAAHCLYSYPRWRSAEELKLRVGVFNRSQNEPSQQEVEVRGYLIHPNYRHPVFAAANQQQYDIALLRLKHPVRLSDSAQPVCVPPRSQEPQEGTLCTVTGWGHLEYGGDWSPEVLHKAEVPLVSYSHCRSAQSYGSSITRNILCAGYREGGQDACQNDSGGPLVCRMRGRWTLYGVVNYGEGCGAPHKYGLYARVTKFSEWINDVMKAH